MISQKKMNMANERDREIVLGILMEEDESVDEFDVYIDTEGNRVETWEENTKNKNKNTKNTKLRVFFHCNLSICAFLMQYI